MFVIDKSGVVRSMYIDAWLSFGNRGGLPTANEAAG